MSDAQKEEQLLIDFSKVIGELPWCNRCGTPVGSMGGRTFSGDGYYGKITIRCHGEKFVFVRVAEDEPWRSTNALIFNGETEGVQ